MGLSVIGCYSCMLWSFVFLWFMVVVVFGLVLWFGVVSLILFHWFVFVWCLFTWWFWWWVGGCFRFDCAVGMLVFISFVVCIIIVLWVVV